MPDSSLQRAVHTVVACGAALSLGVYASGIPLPLPHPRAVAVLVIGLFVGALDLVGRAVGAKGRAAALAMGARVAWPAGLVLCTLPVAQRAPDALWGHLAVLIALAATLILAWRVDRVSPTRLPIMAAPSRGSRLGAWEFSLLALTLAACALYFEVGATAEGNGQNDSAYYFGVARHMAITKRFEEPIVWHFVKPPPTLIHAPFDYWSGLTSLMLAPVLALFGATQHVAFLTMAAISSLSVIAFWYLICVALRLRYAPLQLLALVGFAFSTTARVYRFDTESLPLYHLLLLGVIVGLVSARPRLAVVSGFLLAICRNDGMLIFLGCSIFIAFRFRSSPREVRRSVGLAGGLLAAYMARNLWAFHSLFPPGTSAGAMMENEHMLYRLHREPESLKTAVLRLFDFTYVSARFDGIVDFFVQRRILPAPQLWYLLAAAALAVCVRRPRGAIAWLPAVALFTVLAIVWTSGAMFHNWRTVTALLPLLILALVSSVSMLFDGMVAVTRRCRSVRRVWALGASALVFALMYPIVTRIEVYGPREKAGALGKEAELRALDPILGGAPVAATLPWLVMAQTGSPVVGIPEDGDRSVGEALRAYEVRWLVIVSELGVLQHALSAVAVGARGNVGGVDVERVATPGTIRLFRVLGEGQ